MERWGCRLFLFRHFRKTSWALLAGLGIWVWSADVVGASSSGASGVGWFEDVTAKTGITACHRNRVFRNPYAHIMSGYTALGAAAAVADYDGDGWDDVFLTTSEEGGRNRLYRNTGGFRFEDVTEKAGVGPGNDAQNATADAVWLDFNGDGRQDLFVVRFGRSILYQNMGDGVFRDVTEHAGLSQRRNSITAVAFDYDRDGDVDLLVGSYFRPVDIFNPDTPRFFPESFETASNGGGLTLYRNNGDGTFNDDTTHAGLSSSGWVLDVGHADADGDGDEDIYVAVDFGTDRFYANNGNGTFTDVTKAAIGIDTKKGMNVDWGDFDNDGLPDVYVTNITDDYMREGNFLWHNQGDLKFLDVARETSTAKTGWGWGARFFDYDNDGWLDLYVTNGWVSGNKESYVPDIFAMLIKPNLDLADARNWPPMGAKSLSGYQKKKLFHNEQGADFQDHAARHGVDSSLDGRGVAVADFDNDGRLDFIVANANAAPLVYRNRMPLPNHWVEFDLRSARKTQTVTGTEVRLMAGGLKQMRFIDGGNSFAAQSSQRIHFGLGSADKIDALEIRWASGRKQSLTQVPADRLVHVVEGGSPK